MSRRGHQNQRRAAGGAARAGDRKTRQLCRQVERVLSQVLGGEIDDEVLLAVNVVGVEPAPDAGQLCVTVAPWASGEAVDTKVIQTRLQFHSTRLRAEVAAAICRRKAPMLVYRVLKWGPIPPLAALDSTDVATDGDRDLDGFDSEPSDDGE